MRTHWLHIFSQYFQIFLFACFLLASDSLFGQQNRIKFDHFKVGDGLPDNTIRAMVQDHLGYIWLGTQAGLVKYDGYSFKNHLRGSEKPDSFPSIMVNQILEDREGNFWLGVPLWGLHFFNRETGEFTLFPCEVGDSTGIRQKLILFLHEDREGDIWIISRARYTSERALDRYDISEKKFIHYPHDPQSLNNFVSLPTVLIATALWQTAFFEDSDGVIWIGSPGHGLQAYDREMDDFHHFRHDPDDSTSLSHDYVFHMQEDAQGTLWIATHNGLNKYNRQTGTFNRYYHDAPDTPFCENRFWVILPTEGEDLWVAGLGELHRFHPQKGFYQTYTLVPDATTFKVKNANVPIPLFEDKNKKLWIGTGTTKTLIHLNPQNGQMNFYTHDSSNPEGLYGKARIGNILLDRTGLLWVGTNLDGLNKENSAKSRFAFYQHQHTNAYSLPHNQVNVLCEDQIGRIWIGTEEGLVLWNAENGNFQAVSSQSGYIIREEISALHADHQGNIWVGTKNQGVLKFEPKTRFLSFFKHITNDKNSLCSNSISLIHEDSKGHVWISTHDGLNRWDPLSENLTSFRHDPNDSLSLSANLATEILEQENGTIWITTQIGVNRFNATSQKFDRFMQQPPDGNILATNQITSIFEDTHGTLWIGTQLGGLTYFDPKTESLIRFPLTPEPLVVQSIVEDKKERLWIGTSQDYLYRIDWKNSSYKHYEESFGLNDRHVNSITEDSTGHLWFVTHKGISRFDPETETCTNFDYGDGIQDTRLWDKEHWNDFLVDKNGYYWLAGNGGLNRFHPKDIQPDSTPPIVHINGLRIGNRDIRDFSKLKPERCLEETEEVRLKFNQNDLSFDFVALHFLRPEKNLYSWKMENYEEAWTEPSTQRNARYTNLSPGEYVFRVKACNADGTWNEAGDFMHILISPPWWATWWARSGFLLLLLGLIFFAYRFQLSKQLEHAENVRLKELDDFKTRFYTNITHEFRTPLTVILGMTSQIKAQPQSWLREGLPMIRRNAKSLLRLVNQMLDLSKIESGKLEVNMQRRDIIPYLKYLLESFESLAEIKGVDLRFESEPGTLEMDYDPEKIENILGNLLSNAIKFTDHGSVTLAVKVRENQLFLQVKDTGSGIHPDSLPRIFERFYQGADENAGGTGVGLALTHELVQLLGGKISAESDWGRGTTFSVYLPITQKAPVLDAPTSGQASLDTKTQAPFGLMPGKEEIQADLPLLLIVEDNEDVLRFLQSLLGETYRLDFARNGKEGLEKALSQVPDLMITDVMMPIMDGFELCEHLKTDMRTSHIPVVMLTAKADQASRITGLRQGADAYLTKPFDKEELFVRLEKLLELRASLQRRYGDPQDLSPPLPQHVMEDNFIQEVRTYLYAHLSEDSLTLEALWRELGMSRAQFYRKFKALTDISPAEYLKTIRLHKAYSLLRQSNLNVTEVAFEVGFRNASHFSRIFTEQFGQSPSKVREG